MKILVIDNAERLAPLFSGVDAQVTYVADEIQALNAVEQQQPELIFLDYAVVGDQTPEYIYFLLQAADAARLVVVGSHNTEDDIFCCLLKGANGYQDRQLLPNYLEKLIRVVSLGEAWISRKMASRVLEAIRQLNLQVAVSQ
ncbi:MAG: hypothetical protein ACU836_07180 [Gammaproteobacteria bacterium]